MSKINLRDEARDVITGYTGICIARTEWLNGCVRVTLQAREIDKDGKPPEGQTFDEPQLELIRSAAVALPGDAQPVRAVAEASGGPIPRPSRARDPR